MIERTARRQKSLDVTPLPGARLRVLSTLRDTSTSVADPDDVEVIHDLRLDVAVTLPGLEITDVSGHAEHQPYGQCALTVAPLQRLRGLSLTRGYRREVMQRLGGTRGCSHFLTLALDLSAANVLSIYLRMRAETENTAATRADGRWAGTGLLIEPRLLNACLALAEDSPVQELAREALQQRQRDDR